MEHHDPVDAQGILGSVKAQDRQALNVAIQRLINEVLIPVASKAAGRKRRQVDLQPESVVQSVIADQLPVALEKCSTEAHLEAWLVRAVKHKILDREKKGGAQGKPQQFSQSSGEVSFEPLSSEPEPAAQVTWRDADEREQALFASFTNRALSLVSDPSDRRLVQEFVIAGRPWAQAAKAAGVSNEAARKRMSRLRPSLSAGLCESLRPRLNGVPWTIAEGLLVKRLSDQALSKALDITVSDLQCVFRIEVLPAWSRCYGSASWHSMCRLMGIKGLSA